MPIDITAQPRRAQFVISGTGPYSCEFEILDATDIVAYRDATALTYPTHYSVTIAENGKFSVTLVSGTGTTLTVLGARPYSRLTDFQTGGDFKAVTVDREFDSFQIQIQQIVEELSRSMKFSATGGVLPAAFEPSDYASKFLAFDADGNPIPSSGTTGTVPVSTFMETVLDDTTARAVRATIGYYDVEPSMSVAAVQAVIDAAAAAGRQVVWRGGSAYAFGSSQILMPALTDWIMDGDVIVIQSENPGSPAPAFYASAKAGIRIRNGMTIRKTGTDSPVDGNAAAMYFLNCSDVLVEDLSIQGKFYVGLTFDGCDGFNATRIHTRGVQNRAIYPYRACVNGTIRDPDIDGRAYGGSTATTAYGVNYNAANTGDSNYIESVNVHGGQVRYCTHQGVEFGDLARNCGAYGVTVSDVTEGPGFLIQKANTNAANRVQIIGGKALRCKYGVWVSESLYFNIAGFTASECTLDGVLIAASSYGTLSSITAQGNTQAGISLTGASLRNTIMGGALEGNAYGLALANTTQENYYSGLQAHNNGTADIADSNAYADPANLTGNQAGTNVTSS